MKKLFTIHFMLIGFVAVLTTCTVVCDDTEANKMVKRAEELAKQGDFKGAADKYRDAEFMADQVLLKANALKRAAKYYGKGGKLYKEFECLEEILTSFPDYINFQQAVEREFEIGDAFFQGHRDSAFNWIPWVKENNKAIDVYEKALRRGPFAKNAAQCKLRLGRLYFEDDQVDKGLETFRELIKLYPDTPEEKYAYLELGNVLAQLADKGDGDGKYGEEAEQVLRKFIEKYPKDSEIPWAKDILERVRKITAKRLYHLAEYYNRNNNRKTAERYLNNVIKYYYDTPAAYDSEELLGTIDGEFKPTGKKYNEKHFIEYKIQKLPPEPEPLLVAPENSNGKWLLPIRDLGIKDNIKDETWFESEVRALSELDKKEEPEKETSKDEHHH